MTYRQYVIIYGMSKKDLLLALIIGLVAAVILLLVGLNISVKIPFGGWVLIILPIVSISGLWLASLVARKIPLVWQFAKFFLVGALNTLIDLGVLNLLILLTGIAQGRTFSLFKGIAFVVAVINSYYWNKLWTFKAGRGGFGPFFLVSAGGLLVNIGVASFVVNILGAPSQISLPVWANVGALVATFASLVWNFIGYKFIVFKNEKRPAREQDKNQDQD